MISRKILFLLIVFFFISCENKIKVIDCNNQCSLGEFTCDSKELSVCLLKDDGCLEYKPVKTCKDSCDGNKCKNEALCEGVSCSSWKHCDKKNGTCVLDSGACDNDTNCTDLNTPKCVNNSCVSKCLGVSCSSWKHCDESSGSCVLNPNKCDNNGDCSSTQKCENNTCVSKCEGVSCSSWKHCNQSSGTCVLNSGACDNNSNCSSTQKCEENVCVSKCASNNCNSWESCIPESGNCELKSGRCNNDSNCTEEKPICSNNKCEAKDSNCAGVTCPDWKDCEESSGSCVLNTGRCDNDSDCSSHEKCENNTCVDPSCAGADALTQSIDNSNYSTPYEIEYTSHLYKKSDLNTIPKEGNCDIDVVDYYRIKDNGVAKQRYIVEISSGYEVIGNTILKNNDIFAVKKIKNATEDEYSIEIIDCYLYSYEGETQISEYLFCNNAKTWDEGLKSCKNIIESENHYELVKVNNHKEDRFLKNLVDKQNGKLYNIGVLFDSDNNDQDSNYNNDYYFHNNKNSGVNFNELEKLSWLPVTITGSREKCLNIQRPSETAVNLVWNRDVCTSKKFICQKTVNRQDICRKKKDDAGKSYLFCAPPKKVNYDSARAICQNYGNYDLVDLVTISSNSEFINNNLDGGTYWIKKVDARIPCPYISNYQGNTITYYDYCSSGEHYFICQERD